MNPRFSYLLIILTVVLSPNVGLYSQQTELAARHDEYRKIIRRVISSQSEGILLPQIQTRLYEELERPFAFGGKSNLLHASTSDLACGWELFAVESEFTAVVEFTIGSTSEGRGQQITVSILARIDSKDVPKMMLVSVPVGAPSDIHEIEKSILSDQQLRELGLKKKRTEKGTDSRHR